MGWIGRCQSSAIETPDAECSHLELSIISAQDVKKEKFVGQMQAYAVAWIKPELKMRTHVVYSDDLHPTWNARLNFEVEDDLFAQETAAMTVEIYTPGRIRDSLIGTVRVLLSNLTKKGRGFKGAQFLSLQIRRPSGRPQGILNIGSVLLDEGALNISPMREFRFLDSNPSMRFPPLKEIQELCRKSFSVSRDDLPREKPSKSFAKDDNSLHLELAGTQKYVEEEESLDVMYRKLKGCTRRRFDEEEELALIKLKDCKADQNTAINKHEVEKEQDSIKNHDQLKGDLRISEQIKDIDFANRSNSINDVILVWNEFTLHKKNSIVLEEIYCKEDACHRPKKNPNTVVEEINCTEDAFHRPKKNPIVFAEINCKEDAFHRPKKNLIVVDESNCKEDACGHRPVSHRPTWAKKASWALRKGAAKIHLSPSEKEIGD